MVTRTDGRTAGPHPPEKWFSVAEAARLLGLSRRAIQLRAKKGKLAHKRVRSEDTGRIRLLVYSDQLAARAAGARGAPGGREDFVPRFADDRAALMPEEFQAIARELGPLDQAVCLEADRLRRSEEERDRLGRELARTRSALEAERSTAARHERSLHRFIDRQQEQSRGREERLLAQVAGLARDLGRAEHQVLQLRRQGAWWRRLLRVLRFRRA